MEKLMNKLLQKLDTIGLLLLLAAVLYYSVANIWNKWAVGLAIVGALLIVIGVGTNYKQILNTLGKRSAKYAGNYVFSVILVIALVSGLNYLGQRHPKRFDLTAVGNYTLAPQSEQVLKKLNKDLTAKAFFPGGNYAALRELLTEYQSKSGHIKVEFIDPDKHPEEAKQYDVTTYGNFANPLTGSTMKYGTVVLIYGDRREKVEKRSAEVGEEDLTNAIIKLQQTEVKKIYFIEGHGERDASNTEKIGYSVAKKSLEEQGYQVATVNLATAGKVPDDAKVLIEAGPETEPFPQELQLISEYQNKGGNLLVLLNAPSSPSLESLVKEWGIQVDSDIVLDVSGIGQLMNTGPSVALVSKYETHRITNKFNAMTFFPLARSVQAAKTPVTGVTVDSLFKSSSNSWGKTNMNELKSGEVKVGEKDDLKGPLSLAMAATKEIKAATDNSSAIKARMVVVGNSGFAVNGNFSVGGNGNLFLNMVSWLAQDEDLISIRAKTPEDRRLILSQSQLSMLRLISIFLLPGAALFIGIAVWTRRRR
jgi:ABC-type uncharacterized transport system involved in gliding motility auxiliary subunit